MKGIAVDQMSTHNTAQNANVLKEVEEAVELQPLLEQLLAEAAIRVGLVIILLVMDIAMISTTI